MGSEYLGKTANRRVHSGDVKLASMGSLGTDGAVEIRIVNAEHVTIQWRVRSQHPALQDSDLKWTKFQSVPEEESVARLADLSIDEVFEYRLKP